MIKNCHTCLYKYKLPENKKCSNCYNNRNWKWEHGEKKKNEIKNVK